MNRRRQRVAAKANQLDRDDADRERGAAPEAAAPERAPSGGTMSALASMIKDLEQQLDSMVAMNEAVRADLEAERHQRSRLERTIGELEARLRLADAEIANKEDLEADIDHLKGERHRQAAVLDELRRQLETSKQEREHSANLASRLQGSRDDLLEELKSIESQFDRAMQLVADLRTRLTVVEEERGALSARLKATEQNLRRSESERRALRSEVDESRAALDEIRRSLVDAYLVSPGPGEDNDDD